MPTTEAANTVPRRSRKLLIIFATGTACLALAGALIYATGGVPGAFAQSGQPVAKPIFVSLEPLTVNLQSEGKSRFLHVGLALKMRDDKAQAQVQEVLPELRSRLLLLLSDRAAESLLSAADKARLAHEITAELNRPLSAGMPTQGISGVAFNAFVVQ